MSEGTDYSEIDEPIEDPLSEDLRYEGLSLQDLSDFAENPIWLGLMTEIENRIKYNKEVLEMGDVFLRTPDERGYKYRSDEGLRGGILELLYIVQFVPSVEAEIKLIQENLKQTQKETSDE